MFTLYNESHNITSSGAGPRLTSAELHRRSRGPASGESHLSGMALYFAHIFLSARNFTRNGKKCI